MKGIEEGYELPPEAEDDVWSLTDRERKALGIQPLPKTLYEAIAVAEESELLAETLGEQVYDFFLRNKRAEWDAYRGQVSRWERDQMLPGHLRPGRMTAPTATRRGPARPRRPARVRRTRRLVRRGAGGRGLPARRRHAVRRQRAAAAWTADERRCWCSAAPSTPGTTPRLPGCAAIRELRARCRGCRRPDPGDLPGHQVAAHALGGRRAATRPAARWGSRAWAGSTRRPTTRSLGPARGASRAVALEPRRVVELPPGAQVLRA